MTHNNDSFETENCTMSFASAGEIFCIAKMHTRFCAMSFALLFGMLFFAKPAFAQLNFDDSVKIRFTISSCPLTFRIDSLSRNPFVPGMPITDTFFLAQIYAGFTSLPDSLDWGRTYLVGRRKTPTLRATQAIQIRNIGCIPFDIELSTFSKEIPFRPDSAWWEPNDSNISVRNRYTLAAIASGLGTPALPWLDTVNFHNSSRQSIRYIVPDTSSPREIMHTTVDSSLIGYFYSADLLGYATLPTITSTGLALMPDPDTTAAPDPDSHGALFLHIALTMPPHTSWRDRREGLIVLVLTAKPH